MALWGALTLSFGAITATFQNDIKKLVAYSTISQIGYLVCGCGFCCYEEVLLYLIALIKLFYLFLLVTQFISLVVIPTCVKWVARIYIRSI
jgi:NADH:ubiquinone oxidoreductase subunit 5 (subunit L)/multisubunit Na+/H+ antiporter MnhA subunit